MFRISDLLFDIEDAFVDAFIDEDAMSINWGLNISGVCRTFGFERWRPRAQIEIFASMKAGELSDWKMMSNREVSWEDKYDEDDEMYGSLYLFEHNPIYESSLLVGVEGDKFRINWAAKTDVNWDDKYGQNLDLEIKEYLPFKGIWCGRKSEKDSIELLEHFFSTKDFAYTKTEHGVSLLIPT